MNSEQWALVVAVVALLVSIGVPVWQSRSSNAQAIAGRRNLLLQKILATKSVIYVSMHELVQLLKQHGGKMEQSQRENLAKMVPRMRQHHDDLQKLHEEWSNFDDGRPLKALEQTLADVDVAYSEAEDTAKLIEHGRKSYEET